MGGFALQQWKWQGVRKRKVVEQELGTTLLPRGGPELEKSGVGPWGLWCAGPWGRPLKLSAGRSRTCLRWSGASRGPGNLLISRMTGGLRLLVTEETKSHSPRPL